MLPMMRNWDIFCRVVDNFGDIGVCWRLARQLADEHRISVRLWVDDLRPLHCLCPSVDPGKREQVVAGVEVRPWSDAPAFFHPGEAVIEAFACELPDACVVSMADAHRKPAWINLEYLSAESWIDGCHGLASPHPALPLRKHFCFPGFSPACGGLLREYGLFAARDQFMAAQAPRDELQVSLFCYDTAPVRLLLEVLTASSQAVRLYVADGAPSAAVRRHFGSEGPWQVGSLSAEPLPFLAQDDYDRLLWTCDVNFVRGEDSFVRAQWAARPFVWQAYRQPGDAHVGKVDAFLERYCREMDTTAAAAAVDLFRAWNSVDGKGLAGAWSAFLERRADIGFHARRWADELACIPDLASSLVRFCRDRV
jgi:uncharacterized repeat protein (TIGR03837 family)